MAEPNQVVYWDASAVLSLLFADKHSDIALAWMAQETTAHLLSTLAYAETCAVIARIEREGALVEAMIESARHSLASWPWRRLLVQPTWEMVHSLARQWPLRGADLWHLACAKGLQQDLPELHLLSFDTRLSRAVQGEGLLKTSEFS